MSDELLSDEPAVDEAALAVPASAADSRFRAWILHHDESWLFTIGYVGLAVVLSVWISLFWLIAVVGVHFALEWMRQSVLCGRRGEVLKRVLWELKLDFALILFALALTAYLQVILGVAGLGGAARLGVQSGARLAGWSRALRGVLLSLDDAAQVARLAASRGSAAADTDDEVLEPPWARWSTGDHVAVWLAVTCIALIFAAPWLTEHTWQSLWPALLTELHPLPGADDGH